MLLTKGANAALPTGSAAVEVTCDQPGTLIDVVALLLGADGKVRSDADMVFFNQPAGAHGAVTLVHNARGHVVHAGLDWLPAEVTTVAITISVDAAAPASATLARVRGLRVTVTVGGATWAFEPPPFEVGERAAVLLKLYRRDGGWRVRAVGQGWDSGLAGLATAFGVDIDPPTAPPAQRVPPTPPAPGSPSPAAPSTGPPRPEPPPAPVPPARVEPKLKFLLPSMSALTAHPLRVTATFVVMSLLGALLKPDLWNSLEILRAVAVVTSTTVLAGAGAVRFANRNPPKPRKPRQRTARKPRTGRRPSRRLPVMVTRCAMCNRPLKDPASQRAGVGPDCRRRYGARPQTKPNPAYGEWERRVEQAQREQAAQQREFDRQYISSMTSYDGRLRTWQAERATPTGQARVKAQVLAQRTVVVDLGFFASWALSEVVTRAAAEAGFPGLL